MHPEKLKTTVQIFFTTLHCLNDYIIYTITLANSSLAGSLPPSSSGKISTSKCLCSDSRDGPWKCSYRCTHIHTHTFVHTHTHTHTHTSMHA